MGAVVLFDGVCNFCNASVNFVIERDPAGYFTFAAIQSEIGKSLAAEHNLSKAMGGNQAAGNDQLLVDSVVLVEDGKAYTHSTAALRIARHLDGAWSVLFGLIVVPKPVRDFFYRLFARFRYRLFGKKDECMIPSPEVRARFL